MPESVELNGMTINLVEDKQTYDAMTKNPNEMYLVGKDYDLVIEVDAHFDNTAGKMVVGAEVMRGDVAAAYSKLINGDKASVMVVADLHYSPGVAHIVKAPELIYFYPDSNAFTVSVFLPSNSAFPKMSEAEIYFHNINLSTGTYSVTTNFADPVAW